MMRLLVATVLLLSACVPLGRSSPHPMGDPEEYAVWGAVLDELYARGPSVVVVTTVDTVASAHTANQWELDHLHARGPRLIGDVAVRAFFSPDSLPIRVDPRSLARHTRLRIAVTPRERARASRLYNLPGPVRSARVTLSRVAFDRANGRALVGVAFVCGMVCGSGGTVVVARDPRGRWRLKEIVTMGFF